MQEPKHVGMLPCQHSLLDVQLLRDYVRFTVLSFLVFHHLFLDNGSVYRCNTWENHCPRIFSNTLVYILLENIEIIFLVF